jgi:acyl-CoA dehydrogenase
MFEAYESPWMDEELNIMRDAVRKFLAKEFVPHADRWEKQGIVDRDAWTIAGEAGILCASIPEEYGGGGGNFKH